MSRRLLALALACLGALVFAPLAHADREFTTRFAADQFGDMALIGNQLLTCPPADSTCAPALAGTSTTRATDNLQNMTYVDVDSDGTTFDSSTSTLAMPAGATVLFAGLYWSGDTSAGTVPSGAPTTTPVAAPSAAFANVALFKAPGASTYTSLTADAYDTWNGGTVRYGAFEDVTTAVRAAGNGVYTVANVQAGTGADRYAGWSLVVIYRGGTVERNLRVADGLKTVGNSTVTFSVGGLKVPTGTPNARLGIVSWEGDYTTTGDSASFNGTALTDAKNPSDDVFNATNSRSAVTFTAKNPNNPNQLGSDIDVFDITGVLAAGATSGSLSMTSNGDVYAPAAVVTAIDRAPAGPSNEVAPSVSGTAADGQTLTAANGTWNGTPDLAFTYAWQRCDTAGANCSTIPGATAQTYTLTSADAGKTVKGAVTATNPQGNATATSAQTATVAAVVPANTADPAITGTTRVGQTLSTSNGTWSGTTPQTFTYQWQRCDAAGANCADIAGATASTYTLVAADAQKTLRAKVTATNAAGAATDVSAASAQVTQAPANTVVPTVTGTPVAGGTLTAAPGTWDGFPTPTYAYQWQRCDSAGANCVDLPGATGTTYTVVRADQDAKLRVQVTATNSAGTASAASAATATATAAPLNTVTPTLSGTVRDGQTLTVDKQTWTGTAPLTYTYQWQRCDVNGLNCADLAGATGTTYTLTSADAGSKVRTNVTATNSVGASTAPTAASATVAAVAPVNTVIPTVSGTARDGQTLTGANGTWTGTTPLTYTYQWQRCDSAGANCSDISGATAQTYVQTSADVAAKLRVRVTATNTAGSATAASAVTAAVAAQAPVNTVAPTLSGSAADGATLTVSRNTWTGTPVIAYAYQWQRCDTAGANCAAITGATATTYALTGADVGKTLRAQVIATNAGGTTTATTAQSATVAAVAPVNTVVGAVSGTLKDGSTLTAGTGTWTGTAPLTYTYQWQRCDGAGANCADIAGATASTFLLSATDITKTLKAKVTATNTVGNATAASVPTAVVTAAAPAVTADPVVTGTTRVGQTLSTTTGTWTGTAPITYAYQWQRCDSTGANCVAITGATAATYTLVAADAGATLRARVTATNTAGSVAGPSAATARIAWAPANTVVPTVSGTLLDGATVTASDGTWTGFPAPAYAYAWQRCDLAGANCVAIAGATAKTYVLTPADVNRTVRPVVTATNSAGSATATGTASGGISLAPPVNTVDPPLTGTPAVGGVLTVGDGTWTGSLPIAYAYQWERCDASGGGCVAIPGATGRTYTLTDADGGQTVRARVTAANVVGAAPDYTAPSSRIAAAPVNLVAPAVSGRFVEGETVTTTDGTWTGTPDPSFAYQWQRCDAAGANCADIAGATEKTYTLTRSDVGATLKARVTASNPAGSAPATAPAPSAPVAPSAYGPVLVSPPLVTGTPAPGERLTATPGVWAGTGTLTYRYQWRRCDASDVCTDVTGATGPTYDVTDADDGYRLRVSVVARDDAGTGSAGGVAGDAAAATAVTDLGGLTGSLVSPTACTSLTATTVARSTTLPATGKFKLTLKAAAKQVTKGSPLRVALTGPKARLRSVQITVDGRRLRGTALTPAQIAAGKRHRIVARLTPRRGKARSVTMILATAKCGPVLTATSKRGARSRTLLLRVDSRQAVGAVAYRVSASLAKALKAATGKRRGGLQITGRGRHAVYALTAGRTGTLLAGAGKPTVKLAGTTVTVSGLPAGTGIVTLTIPTRTAVRGRFAATATLAGGKRAALKAAIGARKRR